jgi:transcriptional regulator with XRE-family HTH domain
MEQNMATLGEAVTDRRRALGLSQEDVAALGGPSTTTLSKIEHGEARSIRRRTAQDLERALQWERGSVDVVLAGGAPTEIEGTETTERGTWPRVASEPVDLSQHEIGGEPLPTMVARTLREVDEAQKTFEAAVDHVLTSEAALDRASRAAFRALVLEERASEAGGEPFDRNVTDAEVADMMLNHATVIEHEWTRYEMALIERFEPSYPRDPQDGLYVYSRYMDLRPARERVSRLPSLPGAEKLPQASAIDDELSELEQRRAAAREDSIQGPTPPLDAAAHSTGQESAKERMMREQDEAAENQDQV